MLPFIPLALSIVPQLLKSIFGDRGAAVSKDVAAAIQAVTNIDPTTQEGVAAAQALIAGKPELALQLQQKLAEIAAAREAEVNRESDYRRQSDLDDLKTRVADLSNARQQTTTLAENHSRLALAAPILSGIIVTAFAGILVLVMTNGIKGDDHTLPLANIMLGTLAAMATQVANYWLGSSNSSAAKNAMLADAQAALANSTPLLAAVSVPSAMPSIRPTASFTGAAGPMTPDRLNELSLSAARAGH